MLDDGSVHQRQVEICLAYTPTSAGAVSVKREPRLIGKQFQLERFVGRASRQLRKLGKQVPILIKLGKSWLTGHDAFKSGISTLAMELLEMYVFSHSSVRNCRDRPAFIVFNNVFSGFDRITLRLGDKALSTRFNVRKPIVRIDNAR